MVKMRVAGVLTALAMVSATAGGVSGSISGAVGAQHTQVAALVLDEVAILDVEQGKLLPMQRIVIVGTRIHAVGGTDAVKIPNGAQVVNAKGKYLIPGLWDLHSHSVGVRRVYPTFIANGITGVREMVSTWPDMFDSILQQRREIANGTQVGPRILVGSRDFYSRVCTPLALASVAWLFTPDSSGCVSLNENTVATPEQVRAIVDSMKTAGADYVKSHAISDPKIYYAFLSEARRVGIMAVGHLTGLDGRALTEIEASDSGLRTVEHINEMSCWKVMVDGQGTGEPLPDSVAEQRCRAVAQHFKRNGTWLVPTLYVMPNYSKTVGLLHRVGVPLLAGTDVSYQPTLEKQPFETALHDELRLLVEAGLTPLDALRAATLGPAQMLRATDSLGTIAAGKLADVVLLDADPLADIKSVSAIRAVVANGRYFDRAALDTLVAEGRKR